MLSTENNEENVWNEGMSRVGGFLKWNICCCGCCCLIYCFLFSFLYCRHYNFYVFLLFFIKQQAAFFFIEKAANRHESLHTIRQTDGQAWSRTVRQMSRLLFLVYELFVPLHFKWVFRYRNAHILFLNYHFCLCGECMVLKI